MTRPSTAVPERAVSTPDTAPARPRRLRVSPRWAPAILLSPTLALLAVFVIVPVGVVGVLSLYNDNLLAGTTRFVGVENYRNLTRDGALQQALWHTVLYALITVPVIVGIGLLVAVGINAVGRGAALWRTVYFVPAASTLAAMSVVWSWMFYPDTGVVDSTIGRLLGLHDWLNSTTLALPAVAIVGSWQGIGQAMIMFLAGLRNVNPDLLEAARLDRARSWQRFLHVTFPALGPATVFAVVVATRDSLRVFDQIQVMTQGGPVNSSTTLSFLMWQRAMTFNDIGGGSVISFVLLALVLATTIVQLRTFGRRWETAGTR